MMDLIRVGVIRVRDGESVMESLEEMQAAQRRCVFMLPLCCVVLFERCLHCFTLHRFTLFSAINMMNLIGRMRIDP